MENKETSTLPFPWLIWLLAALFYGYEFLIRVSPNVMVPQIMQDFGVKAAALGVMASCFYWAYSLSQVPAGILVDRFGARRLLLLGVALVVGGNLLFAGVTTVFFGSISRFLIGLGSAFAFICTLKLITEWFPPYRFALLAGLTNLLGYVGATLGGAPLSVALDYASWREILIIAAIFGIVLGFAIWLMIPSKNNDKMHHSNAEEATLKSVMNGLRDVLKKPQSWFNAIYAGLMVAPTSTFAALWGVPYLVNVDHIQGKIAAGATSMIFVGVVVGSPFFGWFSDKISRRRTPLIFASAAALLITLTILYANFISIGTLYVLCFLFGFFQSAHVLNFAIAHEINRPTANGAAIGFTNMCVILGGAIFQPVVGILIGYGWIGTIINGIPVYSMAEYHHALFALPLCQALALIVSIFFLRDTFCKRNDDH